MRNDATWRSSTIPWLWANYPRFIPAYRGGNIFTTSSRRKHDWIGTRLSSWSCLATWRISSNWSIRRRRGCRLITCSGGQPLHRSATSTRIFERDNCSIQRNWTERLRESRGGRSALILYPAAWRSASAPCTWENTSRRMRRKTRWRWSTTSDTSSERSWWRWDYKGEKRNSGNREIREIEISWSLWPFI